MQISNKHLEKLKIYLEKMETETYPEPASSTHEAITKSAISEIIKTYITDKQSKILDVGCGLGYALEEFANYGYSNVIGITLNLDDLEFCKAKGFKVLHMDQSFLDFDDNEFDFVWCAHTLEHSPIPLYTLKEFHRVLKFNGYMYLEMPGPGPCFFHERNKNHYSIFTQEVWFELISRSRFEIGCANSIKVECKFGNDIKYWFLCKKFNQKQ